MTPTEALADTDELFTTEATAELTEIDERYRYKKISGSADAKNTYDDFD